MKPIGNLLWSGIALLAAMAAPGLARAGDLDAVKAAGVLRHLGIPYANFITGAGDGFDVEIMQQFAASLGVKYEFVAADWPTLFPDLTGRKIVSRGNEIEDLGPAPVKADVAACGVTVLPWRQKAVDFSDPTFPTQVWLLARKDSPVSPIKPSGVLAADIEAVKALLSGRSLFCKASTCLDSALYQLDKTGARCVAFQGALNELAPALINREAQLTLLDVPDTLVALKKWPAEIKVIGPVGPVQDMAVAFPKSSPKLRAAFNQFLARLKAGGQYRQLVEKYYPFAFQYFPEFFARQSGAQPGTAR